MTRTSPSQFSKPDLNEYFGNFLPPLAGCIAQPQNSFQDKQQIARLNSLAGPFFGGQQYKTRSFFEILPLGMLLALQLSEMPFFSSPFLALIASRTLMVSRQAVGESLRMSNTSGSAYPGTTMRADASVSKGFSAVLWPSFFCQRAQTVNA